MRMREERKKRLKPHFEDEQSLLRETCWCGSDCQYAEERESEREVRWREKEGNDEKEKVSHVFVFTTLGLVVTLADVRSIRIIFLQFLHCFLELCDLRSRVLSA
jgi:hypothetical protein